MAVFPETPDSATCASSDSVVRLLVGRRDSYPAPSRLRAFFMDRLRNEAHLAHMTAEDDYRGMRLVFNRLQDWFFSSCFVVDDATPTSPLRSLSAR